MRIILSHFLYVGVPQDPPPPPTSPIGPLGGPRHVSPERGGVLVFLSVYFFFAKGAYDMSLKSFFLRLLLCTPALF